MTTPSMSECVSDVASQCLGFRAAKAARVVARQYDQALRPLGISIGQYTILMAIGAGAGQSITTLAGVLGLERTTLIRNLRVIERGGLIALSDRAARRKRAVSLTEDGKAMIVRAYPLWQSVQQQLVRALGGGNDAQTRDVLERVGGLELAEPSKD